MRELQFLEELFRGFCVFVGEFFRIGDFLRAYSECVDSASMGQIGVNSVDTLKVYAGNPFHIMCIIWNIFLYRSNEST